MRILIISNLYPPHGIGGYETICRDVADRLAKYGHNVRVLTSDHHISGHRDIDQPNVSRQLKIHGFYGHPWLPIYRLYQIESHNHRMLRHEIISFQPDLVYVWNLGGISKSLLHRLEESRIPVVFYLSDHWIARSIAGDVWLDWWNTPGSTTRELLRNFLTVTGVRKLLNRLTPTYPVGKSHFKNISFCSSFLRGLTAAKGWLVSHAEVIHCAIDTSAFTVKQEYASFNRLLWVGRLSEDKDPITAVRALAAAHNLGLTHLTLDVFGNGEPAYIAQIDGEIACLGLSHHVRRKHAKASEMRNLYFQYDALLFTSNWGEPFAITPLEAMASGLPVITSLDGGQPELARHGINCLVAAAADPARYATRIAELAASPELREAIASTSLAEVRTRFDIEPITRQIENFLIKSTTP